MLSELPLDLSKDYLREYIEKKIAKMYSPQSKAGQIDLASGHRPNSSSTNRT